MSDTNLVQGFQCCDTYTHTLTLQLFWLKDAFRTLQRLKFISDLFENLLVAVNYWRFGSGAIWGQQHPERSVLTCVSFRHQEVRLSVIIISLEEHGCPGTTLWQGSNSIWMTSVLLSIKPTRANSARHQDMTSLHYVTLKMSGLSTTLLNHYHTRCTELETENS